MIKVLIADDEAKVCQLICNLVDWASFDMQIVGTAANGLEALEKVRSLAPDLMITDIRMPGCDGLELIARAKAENDALEFVIISGYRHFEYAQTAIKSGVGDYLLKPIKKAELSATLEKMRARHLRRTEQISTEERLRLRLQSDIDKLRSGLFADLLSETPVPHTLGELNQDYHYEMRPGLFAAFLIKLDCEFSAFSSGALSLLEEKTSALFREAAGPFCYDTEICFQGSRAYGVLNFAPDQREELRRALKNALGELSMQNSFLAGATVTIGLGETVDSPEQIAVSLESAGRAVAERLVAGCGQLLTAPAPKEDSLRLRAQLGELERALDAGLEVLDQPAVLAALAQFSDDLLAAELSGEAVLLGAEQAYALYLRRLDRLGFHLPEILTEEQFSSRADLCGSAAGLFRLLRETVAVSLEAVAAERRAADTRPIRAAKQYIQEHFAQPLTLEEVSGIAGFNPSYFSSLFKKECGQNFIEYLAEVRIAKAKELLRDSNLSVAEICEAVGYLDLKYFTKTFKKATGIKPGEFRKLYS